MENEKNDVSVDDNKHKHYVLLVSIISTLIFGLLAHGFAFSNLFPSYDSLSEFDIGSGIHKIKLGRFMYVVLKCLLGESVIMPWLTGMLSLLIIGLASYYTCKIFNLKRLWQIVLISAVFSTNLVVCGTLATFGHDLLGNCMALLLSVLSAYLLRRSLYNISVNDVFVLICLVATLGFYQAYIAVTITLMMFVYIIELIENKKQKISKIILSMLKVGTVILVACIAYYICAIIASKITHYELYDTNTYNSIDIKRITPAMLVENFLSVYRVSFETFFVNGVDSFAIASLKFLGDATVLLHILLLLFVTVVFCLKIFNEKLHGYSICLICIIVILLPIGMNFTSLISGINYILMKFALNLVYVLVPIACTYFKDLKLPFLQLKHMTTVAIILVFLIVAKNISVANQVYVKKELIKNSTLFYTSEIVSRIEKEDIYEYGKTPVVIVGLLIDNSKTIPAFSEIDKITGVGWRTQVACLWHFQRYFDYYLQYDINLIDYVDIANEDYDQALEGLEDFPRKNCILVKDGMIFIKLS